MKKLIIVSLVLVTILMSTPGVALAATNLALNQPATASSIESGARPAQNAVDGAGGTRWASAPGIDPQWIYVDLGATYNINRVVLLWETAYGSSYQIQVSPDASTWTSIYSTTTGDGGTDDLTVSGSGRYVRMYGTARVAPPNPMWGYSLWEFEVYATQSTGSTGDKAPDNRLNWKHGDGYSVLYARQDDKGNPVLHLYCIDAKGNGYLGTILTQELFNKAPAKPDTNTQVGETDACRVPVKFYVLTTGEYQINIGPNAEGKVDVIVFTELPPTKIHYDRLKW